MSDNIDVKIKATTDGVQSAADQIKALGEGASSIVENFAGIGEALAAAFAVDKIEEFSRGMAELGEGIERTSKMTGLSADDVQKFQFAVKMTGGDAEAAGMSLLRLERNIADAAAGSEKAQKDFAAAGVSAKTLASGDVNAILGEMADKFSKTADGANKTALAMSLAGRGGASLIPVLDQGRAGFEAMNVELDQTNSKLTEAQVKGFAKTAEQIKLMDAATLGVSEQIMTKLNPGIDGAVVGLTQLKEEFSQSIKEGGVAAQVIGAFGDALMAIVAIVDAVKTAFIQLWDVVKGVTEGMAQSIDGVGAALQGLITGHPIEGFKQFWAEQAQAVQLMAKGFAEANGEGQKFWATMQKMQGASDKGVIGASGEAKDKKKTDQIVLPDQSEKADNKDDAAQQRQLIAAKYDTEKEAAEELVTLGTWTNQQKFSDLQKALAQEKSATDASFQQQMDDYEGDEVGYQKLVDEKQLADEKFNIESMKLTDQAAKESAKSWTTALDTIDKDFDTMLTGVLQGTQTIGQAFERMAGNMIISFMEAIAKMLIQQAALFAATQAGATQTAAAIGGAGGGGGGVMGQLVTQMLSLVGITTVQTTAQTANTTAIAALTAAVTANTAAQGAGGSSGGLGSLFGNIFAAASYDTGTNFVPDDMVANIHKGEIIIPAGPSQQLRDGTAAIGGGGTSIHFNVSAMDSKSVKQFFNQHGATIAKTLSNQVRGGNRSLLSHV